MFTGDISRREFEEKARDLGMVYKFEVLVFEKESEKFEEAVMPPEEEPKLTTVVVKKGTTLHEVAQTLKAKGIVNNLDLFIELANELQLSDKIRTGTYDFKTGEDTYGVILTLCGRKECDES